MSFTSITITSTQDLSAMGLFEISVSSDGFDWTTCELQTPESAPQPPQLSLILNVACLPKKSVKFIRVYIMMNLSGALDICSIGLNNMMI